MLDIEDRAPVDGVYINPGPPSTCEVPVNFNDNVILESHIIKGRLVHLVLPDTPTDALAPIYLTIKYDSVLCDFSPVTYMITGELNKADNSFNAKEDMVTEPIWLDGDFVLTPSVHIGNEIKWVLSSFSGERAEFVTKER